MKVLQLSLSGLLKSVQALALLHMKNVSRAAQLLLLQAAKSKKWKYIILMYESTQISELFSTVFGLIWIGFKILQINDMSVLFKREETLLVIYPWLSHSQRNN